MGVTRFEGYPAQGEATAIPNTFFTEVLPAIDDPAELAVTAYVFFVLGRLRRFPRHVTASELAAEEPLLRSLHRSLHRYGGDPLPALRSGLELAVERGTLLGVEVARASGREHLYLLNTPSGRRDAARIRAGTIALGRPVRRAPAPAEVAEKPNIFRLYEDTFGTLSPAIARALELAEGEYPAEWIERAFRDAATYRARNWGYVKAILQRWMEEGQDEEAERSDPGVDAGHRYTSGRYGQYVD